MDDRTISRTISAAALALGLGAVIVGAQAPDSADAHRAAAKAAAGTEHTTLLTTVCPNNAGAQGGARGGRAAAGATADAATATTAAAGRGAAGRGRAGGAATGTQTATGAAAQTPAAGGGRQAPARDTWHAEPVKVFDNLYFLGQTEYSVWAVTTSQGIIVIDTIFDYSVEDEVVGGMKKLGLDPAQIKYALVSHGHGDHSGGAKYLQDHFGTRVLMSAADWDLLDRTNGTKPKRDMVVVDGQKLTLGDETLTMYLTPGHTPGTISTIVPVKDNGVPHVMAAWGGTAFNFTITPDKNREYWFNTYIASAERFRDIAAKAGADGMIANHTNFDNSKTKLPKVLARKPGEPNPYVIGADSVRRYLTVVQECAKAALIDLKNTPQ